MELVYVYNKFNCGISRDLNKWVVKNFIFTWMFMHEDVLKNQLHEYKYL